MLRPAEPASRPDACTARTTQAPADRAALWSICFALFAAATSLSSLFVILPSVGRELGMTTTQVGLVIAPAGLLFVLAGPVWGRFGANLPRGPVLSISLTAIGILTLLFGVVIDLRLSGRLPFLWCFGLMAACRLLVAIFAASILPTAQAHIAETSQGKARTSALALMGASFALGMVASPGVVAFTARWGIVVPFYVVAASLLPAVVLLRLHVRAAGTPRRPATTGAVIMRTPLRLLTQRAEPVGDQARVGGWCGAAQGLGMVVGPMSGSASYQWHPVAPYVLATTAMLAVCVLHAVSAAPRRHPLVHRPRVP